MSAPRRSPRVISLMEAVRLLRDRDLKDTAKVVTSTPRRGRSADAAVQLAARIRLDHHEEWLNLLRVQRAQDRVVQQDNGRRLSLR